MDDFPNIALSGWNCAGTSTLGLILTDLLQRKYYPITKVVRYLNEKMKDENEVKVLTPEFEAKFQPIIGKTFDNFVDFKLMNDNGIILDSDISTFRIGKHPKVFSVFLTASNEIRQKRAVEDGRIEKEAPVLDRDKALQEEYKKLWDIDLFDMDLINKKYNLVIDNSEIGIKEELFIVIDALNESPQFKNLYDWNKVRLDIEKKVNLFLKSGKEKYVEKLIRKGLYQEGKSMIKEIAATFPEDIKSFPENIQNIFLGLT